MMRKFNAGLDTQFIGVFIPTMKPKHFDRAVKKFAKFFNVDNTLEDVVAFAEWNDYTLGTTDSMIFVVLNGSDYADIALLTPTILELSVRNEHDNNVVVVL
jgi:hypothetical protein